MTILSDILTGKLFGLKTASGEDLNQGLSKKLIVTPFSVLSSELCFREAGIGISDDPLVVGSGNKKLKSESRQSAFNKNFGTTPGSVMEGNEVAATLPFTLSQQVNVSSASFTPGNEYGLVPDNHYHYTGRTLSYMAKLFAYLKVDSGAVGEAALYDVIAGEIDVGSTFSFSSTAFQIISSGEFSLSTGKVYTYALRKISGGLLTSVSIRSALLTIKLPKLIT